MHDTNRSAPSPRRSPSPRPPGRRRIAAVVVALAVALATLGTTTPVTSARADEDRPAVTWGVRPSGPAGPDGRNAFDHTLDPGASIEDHVGVSNYTDEPLELAVYASDAFINPEGGFDLLPAAERPTDVGSWVRFAAPTVTVPPRSRLEVPFRLTVPADATPGHHTGGIVASMTVPGRHGDGDQLAVDNRVGARLYLRVTGEVAPALAVTDVEVTYHGTLHPVDGGEATVTYTVTNTGNVRLAGTPTVEVSGPFGLGRSTATGPRLDELLPGGSLTLATTVDAVAPLGRIGATVRIAPEPLGLDDVPGAPDATGAASTWAVPWAQLVLVAAVVVALVAQRRLRARRRAALAAQLDSARAEGRQQALGAR